MDSNVIGVWVVLGVAVWAIVQAAIYTHYHPNSSRLFGAWLAVLASLIYIMTTLQTLASPVEDISLLMLVNHGVLFLAIVFLMRGNPKVIIDADDALIILERFEQSLAEFRKMRKDLEP